MGLLDVSGRTKRKNAMICEVGESQPLSLYLHERATVQL
jgi:hypothetical protein